MKKILLATDGSKYAQQAATFLAHLPHDDKIELTVLSVIEPPPVRESYRIADWVKEAAAYERKLAADTFTQLEQLFEGANITLRHVVEEGVRAEKIIQFAKVHEIELIVLGARGHSRVDRLLLGSTSDFVATHADCSVLVVRPRQKAVDALLRVAIGYEDTDAARSAVKEFTEFGWGEQTEVDVVSVVSLDDRFRSAVVQDAEESTRKAAAEPVQSALDQLRDEVPQAKAHVVENVHIGEGLVLFAEEHHCDLLVVGETPHNFLGKILLGSVPRFVLRHAPCSVWIARNPR